MYYRLESQQNEIGVLLDTNRRDNCRRNPLFKYLFEHVKNVVLVSEKYNILVGKAFHITQQIYEENNIEFPINLTDPYHISSIWETVYEMQRPDNISISRMECAYFFESINSCEYYRNYNNMAHAKICKVEIIEEYASFVGDMMWLENINESTATANIIKEAAIHFWSGDTTSNPVKEILFQGKYLLKEI